MKSIFEIHDGDSVEPEYSIPGYEITVRPVHGIGFFRMEVYRRGAIDAALTAGLRRFDGAARNRNTMHKVGLWLQQQEAKGNPGADLKRLDRDALLGEELGAAMLPCVSFDVRLRPVPPAELVTLTSAVQAELEKQYEREEGARSEALAFVNEALAEKGVVIESLRVDHLTDETVLTGATSAGAPFEARVPNKRIRVAMRSGSAYLLLDDIWCPLCGSAKARAPTWCVSLSTARRGCGAPCAGPAHRARGPLNQLDELQGMLRLLHALPTPIADVAAAYLAEQCEAGGVDCDETRRRALERVRAEVHVAEHVEWAVRAIHRGWLPNLARVPNDRHDRTDKPEPPPLEDFVWEAIRQMFPAHVQRYDLRAGTVGRALVEAGRAYERACRGE